MKKIISFPIYGKSRLYLDGGLDNIDFIKKYYGKDWIPRFYIAENCPSLRDYQMATAFGRCELRIMPPWGHVEGSTTNAAEHNSPVHGAMLWRYNALFDDDVEVVLTRDADSRCNPREVDSVMEWLDTGKPIHTMYDHPCHTNSIIMAGLTGWRAKIIRDGFRSFSYYQRASEYFYQWYTTEGHKQGLRTVHIDNHHVYQLLVKPFGEESIYRCGIGTPNPLKVSMPGDNSCGEHLGSCVNEHLRFEEYQ